jgi:hypothetical protein
MSADLLARIERDLSKIGEELWNIDGPDDSLDKVFKTLILLKAQVEVQKSLQATANLLRQVPSDQGLPKQRAKKVKNLVRFTFRKSKRGKVEGDRQRKLRKLDCDALKLCGLSYTTENIVKLGDVEFEFLQNRVAEFLSYRDLSYLLYRSDVDKAVDSKLEDPEDDKLFDNFIQSTQCDFLKSTKADQTSTHSPTIIDTQTKIRCNSITERSGSRSVQHPS